ncbi:tetratricopeptide repeat protein [Marivirga atlantica]|jgi:tetratricopeptide (TPR) repeat protein
MNHMRKLFYAALMLSSLTFTGCALNKMMQAAEEQAIDVTPNPLELHGGEVAFTVDFQLPAKMLKDGITYTVNPYYVYGDKEIALDAVDFKKADYPNSDTEPVKSSQEFSFEFEDGMTTNGELLMQGTATIEKNGKTASTDRKQYATGIITTSQMVEPAYYAAYANHGYNNKEELLPTNVNFYFDQGRSVLKTSEIRSDRGQKFNAFIADKNVTRTVTITGTHSPEGPERINKNLSEDRAKAIEDYYRRQMRRYDYKGMADSIKFILKPVVEDWSMFKKAIAEYDGIDEAEKTRYMEIVNGSGSFVEKEDKLHKLSSYDKVFKNIYPDLRAAKTEVLTVKQKKSDAEISVLAKQITKSEASADTLSMEELLYAASLTPSLEEKAAIYKAATKKNDNSPVAHNNYGAVHLELAMQAEGAKMNELVNQAITQFDIANKKKENAESYANLATAYAMQGNYEKAYDNAKKAQGMSLSSDNERGLMGVKGSLEIMMAEYSKAASSLNNAKDSEVNMYNKGLAQILKGDNEGAVNTLEELAGKTSGKGVHANAHYLAAVASANLGKEGDVISHLKDAVAADASLKSKALNDLQFANYQANESFRNALK